jgi:hypothetical protein
MTQEALAQHIRPLLQSCNTANGTELAFWKSQEIIKEVVGIYVLPRRSPFGGGIPRSLLPRVSPV